jgi:hypothetical protein
LPTGSDSLRWLALSAASLPLGCSTLTSRSQIGVFFSSSRCVSPCDRVGFGNSNSNYDYQGIPTILLGLIAIALLPDRPETTKFFTEEERKIALARANRDTSGDIGYHVNKSESLVLRPSGMRHLCNLRSHRRCVQGLEGASSRVQRPFLSSSRRG